MELAMRQEARGYWFKFGSVDPYVDKLDFN